MLKRIVVAVVLSCPLAIALIMTLAACAPTVWAQAAATAPAAATVSIKPVLDVVVALLTSVLTGFGTWSVTLFAGWLKLQKDSLVRKALTDGVNTAINFAIQRLQAAEGQLATVKIQNAVVAEATQFLVGHFPEAIKYFGLNTDAIARMILARLPLPSSAIVPAAGASATAVA